MDLSAILNAFKLPKKVYFLFSVVSGILLFSSTEFLEKLSLVEFKENYNIWIGIVFLLSVGMTFICMVSFLANQVLACKNRREESKNKRQAELDEQARKRQAELDEQARKRQAELDEQARKRQAEIDEHQRKQKEEIETKRLIDELEAKQKKILQNLDNYEKIVLREFYLLEKNTIEMVFDDPTVLGLIKKGVIRQVGNTGYHTTFTGGRVAFFRADEMTIEYFKSFAFPELNQYQRPGWVGGLDAQRAHERVIANLGKEMERLSKF